MEFSQRYFSYRAYIPSSGKMFVSDEWGSLWKKYIVSTFNITSLSLKQYQVTEVNYGMCRVVGLYASFEPASPQYEAEMPYHLTQIGKERQCWCFFSGIKL
jgi:hypothetical protein